MKKQQKESGIVKMKKTAAVLLAALSVLIAAPQQAGILTVSAAQSASQTSSYVSNIVVNSNKGETETDIQNALERIRGGGGTVKLVGKFRITKTLTMYSNQTLDASGAIIESSADKVIYSYKMRNVTVRGGTWNLSGESILVNFSRCTTGKVDSVTTNGGGAFGYGGIYIACCQDISVLNCKLTNLKSEAIYSYRSSDFLVSGCIVDNCGGHGLRIFGSSGFRLYGNRVNLTKGDAVSCSQSDRGEISGNTFSNARENSQLDIDPTRSESRAGCGILISDSADINVGTRVNYGRYTYEGNTITGCVNYGMHITTSTNTFVNRTNISSNGSDGIHNSASSYTVIQNCNIKGCGGIGISMLPGPVDTIDAHYRQCKDSVISNNIIEDCGEFGILLSLSQSCSVSYNMIRNCRDYGIYCNGVNNITIIDGSISGTKNVNGLGIGVSSNSTNVALDVKLELDKSSISLGVGESYQLVTKCTALTWTTSNKNVASVSAGGVITAKGNGTAVITAKSISGRTASCTVTVKNAPSSVSLNYVDLTVGVGESYTLTASIPSGSAAAVRTFRTSNSSIVKMTKTNWEGKFTAMRPGTAWVTVRLYNGLEISCKITVKKAPTTVSLSKQTLTLGGNEKFRLTAVLPSDMASSVKTFRSDNSGIVRMTRTNGVGEFIGVGLGTTNVRVRLYNGLEAVCRVTVKLIPATVSLNVSNLQLRVGQTATVSAVLPPNGGAAKRTYSSSDPSVVKMTKTDWTGSFKAVKKGKAWVTVTLYNGVQASCLVTVY